MRRPGSLYCLIALVAVMLGCRETPRSAPLLVASSAAPATSSSAPAPSRPIAPDEEPPEWQEPTAYKAFDDELMGVPSEDLSRAGQHRYFARVIERALGQTLRIEARLVARGRLESADAARLRSTGDALLRTGRYIADAWQWAPGPYWIEGRDRSDSWLGSTMGHYLSELFLFRSLEQQDARSFAEYVRANRARLDGSKRTLSGMREWSKTLLDRAPETAAPGPSCLTVCVLGRIDYQERFAELDAFEETIGARARLVCRIWPGLATELGGVGECERDLREHHLVGLPWSEAEDGGAEEQLPALVPGRDPPYARFADPLHLSCSFDGAGKQRRPETVAACIVEGRREQTRKLGKNAAVVEAGVALSRRVCALDAVGFELNRLGQTFDHCEWLADLRLGYLASAWSGGAAQDFAAHVRFRRSWGRAAREAHAQIPGVAALPPCRDFETGGCRSPALDDATWKRMVTASAAIQPAALDWGNTICRTWSELSGALASDCAPLMADYMLSFTLNVPDDED